MKLFITVFFAATLALNGVLSLPAGNPSDDAEVIGYPRRVSARTDEDDDDFKDFKGVIDTGSGYPFLQPNPSVLNFGFFDSFDDIFRRFRTNLLPSNLFGGASSDSDEDSGSGGIGISTNFDPKKGNTTSTVKVVDGHKVEVNETVYGDEHSIFKVRVVNVRPLEEGETVEETVKTDSKDAQAPGIKPVTSSPEAAANSDEDEEDRREPLEKKPDDNEIRGNIDEHSTVTENIVETTTIRDEETTMLPTTTTTTEDATFVTDNSLVDAEELLNANENNNGNGNNEFETNMSDGENASNVDNVENVADADDAIATIENNEDTEEVNDNLNESSSVVDAIANIAAADDDDAAQAEDNSDAANEFEEVEDVVDADVDVMGEIVNSHVKHSNYAVIRNTQCEDASSSDDEDDDEGAGNMHATFNDEWGSYNENIDNKENNDFSNDIDVYDVVPIDLSNDIAVNDAPNLPLNPDAEFIDVFGTKQTINAMPKFEKLSLSQAPDQEHLSSLGIAMK